MFGRLKHAVRHVKEAVFFVKFLVQIPQRHHQMRRRHKSIVAVLRRGSVGGFAGNGDLEPQQVFFGDFHHVPFGVAAVRHDETVVFAEQLAVFFKYGNNTVITAHFFIGIKKQTVIDGRAYACVHHCFDGQQARHQPLLVVFRPAAVNFVALDHGFKRVGFPRGQIACRHHVHMRHDPQGFLAVFPIIFGNDIGTHTRRRSRVLDFYDLYFVKFHGLKGFQQHLRFGRFAQAAFGMRCYGGAGGHFRLQINDKIAVSVYGF